jgi:predicted DNA-binding transcriptional regulator AlpA
MTVASKTPMATTPTTPTLTQLPRLYDRDDVCEWLGCNHDTLRRRIKAGQFPPPLPLTDRRMLWSADQITEFLAGRAQAGGGRQKKEARGRSPG